MYFFKFNIGDYASHTRHLSPIEDIAYRRMLDLAYTTEKPLTKDIRELSRLINLRKQQQEITDVLNEFWECVEEGWINNRVLKEIEATGQKSELAARSAKVRWDKMKDANAMREECERNANASKKNANASKNDATRDTLPETHYTLPETPKKQCATFVLPDWVDKIQWDLWMKTRKGKKMIPEQMQMQVEKLEKWKIAGLDYGKSLSDAAINGWQGLFEPKANGRIPKQDNFAQRDYGKGVTDL